MKRILLASAACLAMSLPAMAQTSGSQTNPPAQTQNQPQNQAANQQQTIQPSSLSKSQVRELQMSLNKAGFDAKSVDGIWGPATREAIQNFQKDKDLPGKGELNQQTLAALGVNLNNQSQATANQNGQQHNQMKSNATASMAKHSGSMGNQSGSTGNQTGTNPKTP